MNTENKHQSLARSSKTRNHCHIRLEPFTCRTRLVHSPILVMTLPLSRVVLCQLHSRKPVSIRHLYLSFTNEENTSDEEASTLAIAIPFS